MIGYIIAMKQNTIKEERFFVPEPDLQNLGGTVTVKLDSGSTVIAQCSGGQFKGHKIGNRVTVRLFGSLFSL